MSHTGTLYVNNMMLNLFVYREITIMIIEIKWWQCTCVFFLLQACNCNIYPYKPFYQQRVRGSTVRKKKIILYYAIIVSDSSSWVFQKMNGYMTQCFQSPSSQWSSECYKLFMWCSMDKYSLVQTYPSFITVLNIHIDNLNTIGRKHFYILDCLNMFKKMYMYVGAGFFILPKIKTLITDF